MKRRACITLLGGAAAALVGLHHSSAILAQESADWVTALPRAPVHVASWPAGRKVAVSFALFVEEFASARAQCCVRTSRPAVPTS